MTAKWPTSAAGDADLHVAVNNFETTLNGGIDDSTTTVVLTNASALPATGGYVTIGTEAIKFTGKSGNTLTGVTRGADGTTAAAHDNGVAVFGFIVADHHNALKDEVKAIESYLEGNLGTTALPLTASRALVTDANQKIVAATVTAMELGHLGGVTSAIQTQLGGKFSAGGGTVAGNVTIQGPKPWIDVYAYGAAGDGITDDTTAVQNALNAVPVGGGTVVFPPGTFSVSGVTVARDYTTIVGLGGTLLGDRKNIKILSTADYDHVLITGMRIKGTGKDDGGTSSGRGSIHIEVSSEYCVVHGNIIHTANGSGIVEDGTGNNVISNNLIYETGEHGIYLSSSIGAAVHGNVLIDVGKNSALTAPQCYGIKIDGATRCSITGNTITNPQFLGAQFAANAEHNVFANNTINMTASGSQDGIVCSGGTSRFNVVSGNTIIQTQNYPGIEVTSNGSYYTIVGNLIDMQGASVGILLAGDRNSVKDNTIVTSSASATYGISATSDYNRIHSNQLDVYGSGAWSSAGINLAGDYNSAGSNYVNASSEYSNGGTGNIILETTDGLDIANSARKMTAFLGDNTTWNPGSIADGASTSTSVTVTGAALGDVAFASLDTLTANDAILFAHVTATNSVRVVLFNKTGAPLDVSNGNLKVRVIKWS